MSLSISLKYKKLQNYLHKLAIEDALAVIWAYGNFLQIKGFGFPPEVQVPVQFLEMDTPQQWIAEWDLELLAKEVIIHSGLIAKNEQTLRLWKTISGCIQVLRALENAIYKKYGPQGTIQIEMHRLAHREFVWQSNQLNAAMTARYYKIFNRPKINEICARKFGLTVQQIYHCGIACVGMFFTQPFLLLPFRSEVDALPADVVEKFLAFASLPLSQLRTQLSGTKRIDDRFLYTFNPLRQFPLVRMQYQSKEALVCPVMTLLYWKFTSGLYYDLVKEKHFGHEFGDSFQEYVGEAVARACPAPMRHLPEEKYDIGEGEERTVDWIVLDDKNSALFVECKTKRLTWKAKESLVDLTALESDFQEMASAVVQVYATITDYLAGHYPQIKHDANRRVFPAVVTLENWHLFGPLLIGKLEAAVVEKFKEAGLSQNLLEEMPYSVWPVAELEVGLQIMSKHGIADVIEAKVRSEEFKDWDWHGYLIRRYREMYPMPRLFDDEYDAITRSLIEAQKPLDSGAKTG